MKGKRLWHTLRLFTIRGGYARANYARKRNIYAGMGMGVSIMDRTIPLYSKLIRFHNNVRVASKVSFITHDITDRMLNHEKEERLFQEVVGCIEIMDNVFIGSNSTILSNVRIGPNAIVAAGSVVVQDVPPNSVVGGVPAKVIGDYGRYISKRKNKLYPDSMTPSGQEISDELAEFMWERFMNDRMRD